MSKKPIRHKIIPIILTLLIIPTVLITQTLSAWSPNWGSSTGGSFGGGINGFKWTGARQGARITIVDASSGARAFPTIDVTKYNLSSSIINFGKTTKLDYRNAPGLNPNPNFNTYRYSNFPNLVGNSAKPLSYLKEFVMDKAFHKEVLINFTPELKAMGEERALEELSSGKYKIILEPWVIFTINGTDHCITATEAALLDLNNGGQLDTYLPTRGGIARWAVTLTHDALPKSAYLEREEFGIEPFNPGNSSLMGKFTVGGKLTKKVLPLNSTILDSMGIAILSITSNEGPKIPKVNLKIIEFEGNYDEEDNSVTIKASSGIDPDYPWKKSDDEGKTWTNAPLPGPTPHYFYLQWGSDYDNQTGIGMGQDYVRSISSLMNNGYRYTIKDQGTGDTNIKIDLPPIPEGETFFVAKYIVNADGNAPKFDISLDPFERKEVTRQDNADTLIFSLAEEGPTNMLIFADKTVVETKPSLPAADAVYDPTDGYLYVSSVSYVAKYKGEIDKNIVSTMPGGDTIYSHVDIEIENLTHTNTSNYTGRFPGREYEFLIAYYDRHLPSGVGNITPQISNNPKYPKHIRFKMPSSVEQQEVSIKLTVNPDDQPSEPNRSDNVWETIVKIPGSGYDLIAKDIGQSNIFLEENGTKIGLNVFPVTVFENETGTDDLKNEMLASPVTLDVLVNGVKDNELSKQYVHYLGNERYSPPFEILLPNNPSGNNYDLRLILTINPDKNQPVNEKTFNNNVFVKNILLPSMPPPEIPPPVDIPIPQLALPPYDRDSRQRYLPKNPQTGQESMVLYDIGTTTHTHSGGSVNWIGAPNDNLPPQSATKHLNWGKPGGWQEQVVLGPLCPDGVTNPYGKADQFVRANQTATGFTWWDTESYQLSKGSNKVEKYTQTIPRLRVEGRAHQSSEVCNSNCCSDGRTTLHGHEQNTRKGTRTDSNGIKTEYTYTYTSCLGGSSAHRHWHTDYLVIQKNAVELTGNIKVFEGSNTNLDHKTNKNVVKSGYGFYSTLNYSYETELENGTTCDSCGGGTEAYMFMPHQNKNNLRRIVELDKVDSNNLFTKSFKTAKNPLSRTGDRKQYVDTDYGNGTMPLEFKYRLLAPGFQPTSYPTGEQIHLKNKYPNSIPALGNWSLGSIKVEGNMWDDVWVHPDDPDGAK